MPLVFFGVRASHSLYQQKAVFARVLRWGVWVAAAVGVGFDDNDAATIAFGEDIGYCAGRNRAFDWKRANLREVSCYVRKGNASDGMVEMWDGRCIDVGLGRSGFRPELSCVGKG